MAPVLTTMSLLIGGFELACFVHVVYPYSEDCSFEEFMQRAPLDKFLAARGHIVSAFLMFQFGSITAAMGR